MGVMIRLEIEQFDNTKMGKHILQTTSDYYNNILL